MRRTLVIILATILGVLSAGCAGGAQPATNTQPSAAQPAAPTAGQAAPAAAAAKSAKVKIVYWRSLAGPRGEAQEALAKQFNESQNEVEVEVQFQGAYAEMQQKFTAALAANSVPDVLMLCDTCMPPFARSSALMPLDQFISGSDGLDSKAFFGTILQGGLVDGKQYWIPFAASTPLLFYNPDMFKQAGLSGPPETWDQLFEYARKLKIEEGGQVKRFGISIPQDIIGWWFQSQVWSQGGEYSDAQFNTFVDSEVWKTELGKWRDALHKDKSVRMPTAAEGGTLGDFTNGLTAMIISSTANTSEIVQKAQGFTPKAAFLPGGKAGRAVPSGGAGLAIPAGVAPAKAAAAWKFIKFMVSPKSNAFYAEATGYMPMTEGAVKLMADFLAKNGHHQTSIDQLKHVRGQSELNGAGDARAALNKAFDRIFVGNEDPAKVLPEAQTQIQGILKSEGLKK